MSAAAADDNNDNNGNICANCGKGEEGSASLKACTACKLVKYCNRECQIAHRPQHKKACKKRAAELHDQKLFRQPPPKGDCPICFQRMPSLMSGSTYMACCGKVICSGCAYAPVYDDQGNIVTDKSCPFCRMQASESDEEAIERTKKRVEAGDAEAIHNMGIFYDEGSYGFPQDYDKALELWRKAGELGNAESYCNIGCFYYTGKGVEVDKKKANHYFELAAMRGNIMARHNLGCFEENAGNYDRVVKHFIIAAGSGCSDSLHNIKLLLKKGYATKDDYSKALESYQSYLAEIKSDQRDKAAAAKDSHKYI